MKTLNLDKHGNWIVAAPLVAVNLLYLFLFFLPGQKKIDGMRSQIVDTQMYLATAASQPAEIEQVRQQLDQVETYIQDWQKHAPRVADVARLFSEINRRVSTAGVAVTRFEPKHVDEMEHLDRISLHLSTEGSFAQMFQLLQQLEQLPETVWVDSLKFHAHRLPTNILRSALTAPADASVRSEINLAIFATKTKDSD